MNNLKKALQNLEFTEEQLSQIRKAVMKEADEAHLRIEEDKTDPLIGKWIKRTTILEERTTDWGLLKSIKYTFPGDLNPSFIFEDGSMWGKIACDVDDPRDYEPKTVPADILEGLNLLPEDHPEFGNLRKKAIESAEMFGLSDSIMNSENKIANSVGHLQWRFSSNWNLIFNLAESGAFDPKPVEKRIEFDYERWKNGGYVRVETRDGKELVKLFDFETQEWPLKGLLLDDSRLYVWKKTGAFIDKEDVFDLFLVVNE